MQMPKNFFKDQQNYFMPDHSQILELSDFEKT